MQTFMVSEPGQGFYTGLELLDDKRLGKQRLETQQLYKTIESGFKVGFKHHPAGKMWIGHLDSLALYGYISCQIWIKRGFTDTLAPWFEEHVATDDIAPYPLWTAEPWFVQCHRSKLIGKNLEHYGPLWPNTIVGLPYLWPVKEADGQWHYYISQAENRRAEYATPPEWTVNQWTREVTW